MRLRADKKMDMIVAAMATVAKVNVTRILFFILFFGEIQFGFCAEHGGGGDRSCWQPRSLI